MNNIIGIHFDQKLKSDVIQLKILLDSDYQDIKKLVFNGSSRDGCNWSFSYPDSIYRYIESMSLIFPKQNDSISREIGLILVENKDTLRAGSYLFSEKKHNSIDLSYFDTKIYPNILYLNEKTNSPMLKTVYQDLYIVKSREDSELISSIKNVGYGYSMFDRSPYKNNEDYTTKIQRYISLSEMYPTSQTLMCKLSSTLTFYQSIKDIANVFNCFSEENKQSYFGGKVKKYIETTHFENMTLPCWNSSILEQIIANTTQYTLVVFSASWCIPCHELVPILKQIYSDLHLKLNMVYVSIDEEQSLPQWRKFMEKEHIPWRSLLAAYNLSYIKNKYTVQTIPLLLLVHPDGFFEHINIKIANDRKWLHELVMDTTETEKLKPMNSF